MDQARQLKIEEVVRKRTEFNRKCDDELFELLGIPKEGTTFGVSFDDSIKLRSLPLEALSKEDTPLGLDQLTMGATYQVEASAMFGLTAVLKSYDDMSQSVIVELTFTRHGQREGDEPLRDLVTETTMAIDVFLMIFAVK